MWAWIATRYTPTLLRRRWSTGERPPNRKRFVGRLGILDAIGGDLRWQVLNEICRRIGLMATTYAVYAMSRAEVQAFVYELYQAVLADGDFSSEGEPTVA
jgi:hypothetical protein